MPMMCNPGTKEGVTVKDGRFSKVWPANEKFIKTIRRRGGLLGLAVDPLAAHECNGHVMIGDVLSRVHVQYFADFSCYQPLLDRRVERRVAQHMTDDDLR